MAFRLPTARRWAYGLCLAIAGLFLLPSGLESQGTAGRTAHVLEIEGAIGPATSDYLERSFGDAKESSAQLIILRMDTPGGLDTSMREIIRAILASPVPVVTYVAPSGARAASAGTYVVYASHVAAMAPGTNLGAATPVQIGVGSAPSDEQDRPGNESEADPSTALERKAVNDAVAYLRSLAELRGRNVEWAEQAVRAGASLSASAAAEQNVIDFVARDMRELMAGLDGRTVTAAGRALTIETGGMELVEVAPNWRTRILGAITNPNVALILMLIGVYGLIFEFMNPGALYPGTIGAISLLLGMYALAALPVNFAGIALITLGLAMIAVEAFSPSFGVLGVAGTIALALGATILIDTDVPQFQVDWAAAAGLAVASAILMAVIARLAIKSRRARIVSGKEQLVGASGEVLDWKDGRGHIFVVGERWRAKGVDRMERGQLVEVQGVEGLTLIVEPAATADAPHFRR